jgi:uncharacterized protein YcfJ
MVLPGNGKNFEQFQADDAVCRQWAAQQTGTTTQWASTQSTVSGAAIGTVVGAAAGAAVGAAAGSPATGAAVGAGVGLLAGTAIGASNAEGASTSVQQRYDMAFTQCMFAKGNQIPVVRGSQPKFAPVSYAWADDAEKIAMARVRLSTEPTMAAGCTRIGFVSDDSIKDLRKKIVRAGGDTGVLSFGADDIYAEVFRCPTIPPPPAGTPPPPPPGPSR